MSKKWLAVLMALSMVGAYACSDDDDNGGNENPATCQAGAKKCENNQLSVCTANGGKLAWTVDASCKTCKTENGAAVCTDNNKEPEQGDCTDNALKCDGNNLMVCTNKAWTVKEACPNGCADNQCKPGSDPIDPNACTRDSKSECTVACSADKSEGYYWDSTRSEVGVRTCIGNTCRTENTSVICDDPACDPTTDNTKTCDGDTVKYCNKNSKTWAIKTCNSCTTNADSTYYCCDGQNEKCGDIGDTPKCEAGGTEYCQKNCLTDGSKGYYYAGGKVNEVVCPENNCTINKENKVVCGEGSGETPTCTGDKVTTGGEVGACCDTSTYQVSCINGNANALICSKGAVKQWDCKDSQCSVTDNKVTCPNPIGESDKTECTGEKVTTGGEENQCCDPDKYQPSGCDTALRCKSTGILVKWTCKAGTVCKFDPNDTTYGSHGAFSCVSE